MVKFLMNYYVLFGGDAEYLRILAELFSIYAMIEENWLF